MNPMPPKLYGQLKTHKNGLPIRPVVAYYTDSTYLLAKHLAKWFRAYSSFSPAFSVRNSSEVATLLMNRAFLPNVTLCSFDISSMYSCIPVLKSIGYMCEILSQNNVPNEVIQEFEQLLLLCLKENLCTYNNVIYKFPDGLPMGGPLSCLVADVFMDYFERHLFNTFYTPHVIVWTRYVDDVLCLEWHGSFT